MMRALAMLFLTVSLMSACRESDGSKDSACNELCSPSEASACVLGVWECGEGEPQCVPSINAIAGAPCGNESMCDGAGHCVSPFTADAGSMDAAMDAALLDASQSDAQAADGSAQDAEVDASLDAAHAPDASPSMPDGGDASVTPACGTFCVNVSNPCLAGFYVCTSDAPVCYSAFNRVAGIACGDSHACDGEGRCVSTRLDASVDASDSMDAANDEDASVDAGVTVDSAPDANPPTCGGYCTDPDNACRAGWFDCAVSPPVCRTLFNVSRGASCGFGRTCDGAGECVVSGGLVISGAPQVFEDSDEIGYFHVSLGSAPNESFSITVDSAEPDVCRIERHSTRIDVTVDDAATTWQVGALGVADRTFTGTRTCAVTFSSPIETITKQVRVLDRDFLRISESDRTSGASFDSFALDPAGEYVAFSTGYPLIEEDRNDEPDIYVWTRSSQTLSLVSRNAANEIGNGGSMRPQISRDGDDVVLVFISAATNFVDHDENDSDYDLFRVALAPVPSPAVHVSAAGDPSAVRGFDVRTVALAKNAPILLVSDLSARIRREALQAWTYDLRDGTYTLQSYTSGGERSEGATTPIAISSDARYVAFTSTASDLVTGAAARSIYVRDCVSGQISSVPYGAPRDPDGVLRRVIGFSVGSFGHGGDLMVATSVSLDASDTNDASDAYVLTSSGVSPALAGLADFSSPFGSERDTFAVAMSGNGAYFSFVTADWTLRGVTAEDRSLYSESFIVDASSGKVRRFGRVSRDDVSVIDSPAAVTDDGRFAVVISRRPLVDNDDNNDFDVFITGGF